MKVFIMTDLEGPSGVNGRSDGIGNKIINQETAGKMLLGEVNATVEGLVRGGAKEIVVWDGHGGSNSIDIANLHHAAKLGTIGGGIQPAIYLDASFDAAIQLGAHTRQGSSGYLSHSYNSHSIANMWLNDNLIGELGSGILMAAYFKTPTILVSGDDQACREAAEFIGGKLATVETKKCISRYSVINHNPVEVHAKLTAAAEKALKETASFPVMKMADKFELKIQYMCPNHADAPEQRGATRIDHQTVIFKSNDFIDVCAQYRGWAPGVHNRRFGITPETIGLY